MDKMLIIIPTYNEARNIEALISQVLAEDARPDLLIIDDNSPDGTDSIVEGIAAKERRVHLMKRPGKQGLGTAYMQGFRWALLRDYEAVITMDADFSHQPKYLSQLIAGLREADLVIGSRYIPSGGIEGWPLKRRLLSGLGNFYARTITGIPVRDCTSGFMGIRRDLAQFISSSDIRVEGYSFLLELKNIAYRNRFSLHEMPITFVDRIAGESKISKKIIFEAMILAWKIRLRNLAPRLRGNNLFKTADFLAGVPLVCFLGLFMGRKPGTADTPRSIAVIKLSALGDTILLVPALRALRERYPEAHITAVGTRINAEVFRRCPYIDETLIVNIPAVAMNPLKLMRLFKNRKYDAALDFDQWTRLSPIIAAASGSPRRIGFKTRGQYRNYLYTDVVEHSRRRHETDEFLEIVRKIGARDAIGLLEFWITAEEKTKCDEILSSLGIAPGKPFVMMHPETPLHGGQRQWPLEKFVELGKMIMGPGTMKLVITGTLVELRNSLELAARIGPGAVALPVLPLGSFAAVLARARGLVCGNTGIMHLAGAVGTPVVALHGPTDPMKWGPLGKKSRIVRSPLECSPCLYLGFEYGCASNRCMENISVQTVYDAATELFAISPQKM